MGYELEVADEMADDAMLVEAEVAALLKVSITTLQRWRAQGEGPPFTKLMGAVRYPRSWLCAWLASRAAV